MLILGIDQSFTNSGLVINDNGNITHAEVYSTDKNDDIFKRAWDISEHICDLANKHKADLISIEGLAFGNFGNATRDLAGLQFLIVSKLKYLHDFRVEIISPKELKKFATDKGNAKKQEMLEAVPQKTKDFFMVNLGLKKTKGLYDVVDAYFLSTIILNKFDNNIEK
jgi:Holliday junction resolvasome RuvABC endonuclease subunit